MLCICSACKGAAACLAVISVYVGKETVMGKAWILGGLRSFIGVKDRMYRNVPAEILGAGVLKNLVEKYRLEDEKIDLIIGGNAVGGGGNITRLAALEAGLLESIPAVTLDLQCGSALESIVMAAARIESGLADLVIAGGLESSSTQPIRHWNPNHPDFISGGSYTVAKFIPGRQGEQVMLEGAELTALLDRVDKEEMDPFILRSHRRASLARKEGSLSDIQVSVAGSRSDEGIRENMSQRLIDKLPFLLPDGKKITAANSCLMHDGAAFVILCSERYGRLNGLYPEASFCTASIVGADPFQSPKTAVLAAENLLERCGLNYREIDAFEVNEAFAVIDALFLRKFSGIEERFNVFGGALAYGHPYGASGAIILLHLMKALEKKNGRYGMCCVAAAGGIGSAVLIERTADTKGA